MSDTAATSVLTPCYVVGCCNHFGCLIAGTDAAARLAMSEYRNPADTNTIDDEQQREHTGLRTVDTHASARDVYQACHAPYAGVHVLQQKAHLRAQASSERVRQSGSEPDSGNGGTAAKDRRGEVGVSL